MFQAELAAELRTLVPSYTPKPRSISTTVRSASPTDVSRTTYPVPKQASIELEPIEMLFAENSAVTRITAETTQHLLALEAAHDESFAPILLTPGKWTIGSADQARINLKAEGMLAQHCVILVNDSTSLLKSWDPKTWLNEGTVDEAVLSDGDRLVVGPVEFRLRTAREEDLIAQLPDIEQQSNAAAALMPTASTPEPLNESELDELRQL